jgi:hypothetical protein
MFLSSPGLVSFSCPSLVGESLKSRLKLFMAFARFVLIAFHAEKGADGALATSVEGRENPFAIFIGTYVSSHKSCFAKLTFLRPSGCPHTKRVSFSILFVKGYLTAAART